MSVNWYDKTISKLDKACSKHDKKVLAKFHYDSLKKVISRVAEFSEKSCEKCLEYRGGIDDCIKIIDDYKAGDRKAIKAYNMIMRTIVAHLRKQHKLIEEGTNVATYLPLGLCFGLIINSVFPATFSLTLGMSVGMCLGIAIGSLLDHNAKKNGKII